MPSLFRVILRFHCVLNVHLSAFKLRLSVLLSILLGGGGGGV